MINNEKITSAFISIVGEPNVGKSSLLNALVGEKIAIVSNKYQTTRTRIIGIVNWDNSQFVFVDTPGLHKPRNQLGEYMISQINKSIVNCDLVVMVVECFGEQISQVEQKLINIFKKKFLKVILLLNKSDKLKSKEQLIKRVELFADQYNFEAIISVSALTKEGLEDFLKEILKHAKLSVRFFPGNMVTDQSERTIVAEIVREKFLKNLQNEVPHTIAITIEKFGRRNNKDMMDIEVLILCEKNNHKSIIIGKGGTMLKSVAIESRLDIEKFLNCRVNLKCWVKIREGWRNKEQIFKSIGLG